MLIPDMVYAAATYLRLSKEDGDLSFSSDKAESDSISSHRAIRGPAAQHPAGVGILR